MQLAELQEKVLVTSNIKRILCVEDDRDTCEVLGFLLPEYEITFAHSIEDSSPLVENQPYDLYMLDNWLPDGSGIQLCEKIRGLYPDKPILFTSAIGLKDDIRMAFDKGATRYMVKPVEPDKLIEVVKELVG